MSIDSKSREILTDSLAAKNSVFFSGDGLPITFQTFILAVGTDHIVLENRIRPRFIRSVVNSKRFSLQARMVRFQCDHVGSDGEHLIFPLKEDSVIEETRQ